MPLYRELHEIFGTGAPPGRRVASTVRQTSHVSGIKAPIVVIILIIDEVDDAQPMIIFEDPINPDLSAWKILNDEENEHDSNYDELDDLQVETKPDLKRKRASSNTPSSSGNLNPASKSRRISVHQSAAETAKEGMKDLGESMIASMAASRLPSTTRFDQCLPLLSLMRSEGRVTNGEYLQYCKLLMQDVNRAAMFVGMDEDLRAEWLESEYNEFVSE